MCAPKLIKHLDQMLDDASRKSHVNDMMVAIGSKGHRVEWRKTQVSSRKGTPTLDFE